MEKLVPATTAYKWWNCYDYLQNTSRPRLRLLLSGDVQQSPGPTTKYPCSVCTRNVTSRGVSYQCNNCKNWVHAKCSKLQRVQTRQEMACNSCTAVENQDKRFHPPPPSKERCIVYNSTQTASETSLCNLATSWNSTTSRWQ